MFSKKPLLLAALWALTFFSSCNFEYISLPNQFGGTVDRDIKLDLNEDTALISSVSCKEGQSLNFESEPESGTVQPGPAGPCSFLYIPNENFFGVDQFDYSVQDGEEKSPTAEIEITIAPLNDPPVAEGKTVEDVVDGPVTITLDGSDVDSSFVSEIVADPSRGTLSHDPNARTVVYTPEDAQQGTDAFEFRMRDAEGLLSDKAVIMLTVDTGNGNQAPVAQDGSLTVDKNSSGQSQLVATDDVAVVRYDIVTSPTKGTVDLNSETGAFTFKPTQDLTGTDAFTFRAFDGELYSNVATISITIRDTGSGGTITIDQAWLDAQGDSPYYLDQENKRYNLAVDVATRGTAFVIMARNIIFDLMGHSIKYAGADEIQIQNPSFEQGKGAVPDGWDLSAAPNAARYAGKYLASEVYTGSHSLRFSGVWTGEQVAKHTEAITLQPNTRYSFDAMLMAKPHVDGVTQFIRLVGKNNPNTHEVVMSKRSYRGMLWNKVIFDTGPTAETYDLYVGATNTGQNASVFIEDVGIQLTQVHGVVVTGAYKRTDFAELTRWGEGAGSRVTSSKAGAKIFQGQNAATDSAAIRTRAENLEIDNVSEIRTYGDNSNVIWTGASTTIHHSNIHSDVQVLWRRDQMDAAVIEGGHRVHHCSVIGGPQSGIVGAKIIDNNTVSTRTTHTNGFAILGGNLIHDNNILNHTSDFSGRGIAPGGGTEANPTLVYGNAVRVRELARNQEYGGVVIGGAYGIQIEISSFIKVYGNFVEAHAIGGAEAHALRIGGSGGGSEGIEIYQNILRAQSGGESGDFAHCLKLTSVPADSVEIRDIECRTNDGFALAYKNAFVDLVRMKITLEPPIRSWGSVSEYPFSGGYFRTDEIYATLNFIDTDFTNDAAKSYLDNPYRVERRYNFGIEDRGVHELNWTTTIQVEDADANRLANQPVEIRDGQGKLLASGTTDAVGHFKAVLRQHRWQGDQKVVTGDLTATSNSGSATFSPDKVQTIIVTQ